MIDMLKLPATAKRAKEIGSAYYFTNEPCKRGHLSYRLVSSGTCSQCVAERRGFVEFQMQKRAVGPENASLALAAHEAGQTTYESATACPQGHKERYVSSNNCVQCTRDGMNRRKDRQRELRLEKVYGITDEDYINLLLIQDNKCAVCEEILDDGKRVHIDHCHTTNKVRGLLCSKCNQALGLLREDLTIMLRMIKYVVKHNHET